VTLSVSGLSAIRSGRTILHPTSLSIELGDRIGLVGASGSGKSTLGHALIDDLRAQGRVVAHVPQSPDEALDPLRSMGFHWREATRALGLPEDAPRDAQQRQTLFAALNIENGDLRKRPWGWSRGMQQRFVIAMAMIGAPDLLVMDEPTSALDPVVAARTMALLKAQHVARLLVLDEGRIVEDSPTRALLERPNSKAGKSLCAHRNWMALPC